MGAKELATLIYAFIGLGIIVAPVLGLAVALGIDAAGKAGEGK